MAEKNGNGIVYNCSDCGDNYVRMYAFGGEGAGSPCETWGLNPKQIQYVHDNPGVNHTFESLAEIGD
jgi:hypothetical protein